MFHVRQGADREFLIDRAPLLSECTSATNPRYQLARAAFENKKQGDGRFRAYLPAQALRALSASCTELTWTDSGLRGVGVHFVFGNVEASVVPVIRVSYGSSSLSSMTAPVAETPHRCQTESRTCGAVGVMTTHRLQTRKKIEQLIALRSDTSN